MPGSGPPPVVVPTNSIHQISVTPHLFISYSRKDYYFAESLCNHLIRKGRAVWLDVKDLRPGGAWNTDIAAAVDTASAVLVVASTRTVDSPDVKEEIERAAARNKRIVVVWFHGRLPRKLAGFECVDFRSHFSAGLTTLLSRLEHEPSNHRPQALDVFVSWPKLPRWILAVLAAMVVPTISYFWGLNPWAAPPSDLRDVPVAAFLIAAIIYVAVAFRVACWSFLSRRMGMTGLSVWLSYFVLSNLVPLLVYWRLGRAALEPTIPETAGRLEAFPLVFALVGGLPLATLVSFVVFHPEDLLRWTPTGKAWDWYRRACSGGVSLGSDYQLFTEGLWADVNVAHDPVDESAAQKLREIATNASTTGTNRERVPVLLLTNRTRRSWLEAYCRRLPDHLLIVVGTTIQNKLIRRGSALAGKHWVDFRRWTLPRTGDGSKIVLPLVPEALNNAQYPLVVEAAHHLLCAFGAFQLVMREFRIHYATSAHMGVWTVLAYGTWISCGMLSRVLLLRSFSQSRFYLGCLCAVVLGTVSVVGTVAAVGFSRLGWRPLSITVLFLGLVYASLLAPLLRTRLGFWFPAALAFRQETEEPLAEAWNWRSVIWSLAYVMIWGLLLGVSEP
jgi:hypothetical protein